MVYIHPWTEHSCPWPKWQPLDQQYRNVLPAVGKNKLSKELPDVIRIDISAETDPSTSNRSCYRAAKENMLRCFKYITGKRKKYVGFPNQFLIFVASLVSTTSWKSFHKKIVFKVNFSPPFPSVHGFDQKGSVNIFQYPIYFILLTGK